MKKVSENEAAKSSKKNSGKKSETNIKKMVVTNGVGSEQHSLQSKMLYMQWHITERCNLRCKHCYQGGYQSDELSLDKMSYILDQCVELLDFVRENIEQNIGCSFNITGGEPFVRKDFFDFLELFGKYSDKIDFGILTNGYFINEENIEKLKSLNPRFIQLSMEGNENTHDSIRGKGNFTKTVEALKLLVKHNFFYTISFTAHRGNFREFPDVVKMGRELGVSRIWTDRSIPTGSGKEISDLLLSKEETKEYIELLSKLKYENIIGFNGYSRLGTWRALQFLEHGFVHDCNCTDCGLMPQPYTCEAGRTLVTILSSGDVVPCRRMPIPAGNVLETSLIDLFLNHPTMNMLRDDSRPIKGCENCKHVKTCRGGLKCLAYAINGDPYTADPGCWLAET